MPVDNEKLVRDMEYALNPGSFINYSRSWDFVSELHKIRKRLDSMAEKGNAKEVVKLFEIFLAGSYEKANEIDDSGGNFGVFLRDLFCSWVKARQLAGMSPEETVKQVFSWFKNDTYGFCFEIEGELAGVFGKKEFRLFEREYLKRLEEALEKESGGKEHSWDVKINTEILKQIYKTREKVASYLNICEKVYFTPADCQALAEIYKSRKKYVRALEFTDKGIVLQKRDKRSGSSACALTQLKRRLLSLTGKKEEALGEAWKEFEKYPAEYNYKELMEYVPENKRDAWHKKAIAKAKVAKLSTTVRLLIYLKEADILADKILDEEEQELERIGYYRLKAPLKILAKTHPRAAAKIYKVLAMEIVKAGRSQHYKYALSHLARAREIYGPRSDEWKSVEKYIDREHSRKRSFYPEFRKIASGEPLPKQKSFEQKAREKWWGQVSGPGD